MERGAARSGNTALFRARALLALPAGANPAASGEAVRLVNAAAEAGDSEAAAFAATLAAAGTGAPADWDRALDWLLQSAQGGWQPARDQLRVLAADDTAAQDWPALRARVRIAERLRCPGRQPLLESPRLRRIAGFASPAECRWLIERARGRLQRARNYDPETAAAVETGGRTNREADFTLADADLVVLMIRARIATAMGLPTAVMEQSKVLHYAAGQHFAPHFDFLEPSSARMEHELAQRGQRLATFLLYLNADYEDGETDFPTAGFRHRGGVGDALYFANVDPAGQPDRRSLHAGLPPRNGEKWLLSQWLRDRSPAS